MQRLSTLKEIKELEKRGYAPDVETNYAALLKSAQSHPDNVALQFIADGDHLDKPQTWTYTAFIEEINAAANLFNAYGLRQQDTVSYILPNLPATCFTFFGGEARGIINPINPMLENQHIAEIMKAANTKILVTLAPSSDPELWAKIEKVIALVPQLETVFTVSSDPYSGQPSTLPVSPVASVRVLGFFEEAKKQNRKNLDFTISATADSIASYFHTGGTTGSPKLAQRTHANELANATMVSKMLALDGPKVFLCGLPWFHANAVMATGMTPLYHGHSVILASPQGYREKTIIKNFWKIIEAFKVNLFSAVPTILKGLLSIPIDGAKIDSLEFVICGAAPLSTQLFNDFQNTTGIRILEGYGFTEGVCVNTINPPYGVRKIGSIGLPLPFHEMKVAVIDHQNRFVRDASTDEIGVFIARGTNVFPGYKEEADNKNSWIIDGNDKWYNTGDIGRQDADGYFWITGRQKELIIRAGHNIDPKSIEEPISRHPAVAAVAAVSRPDAHAGELPVAYVELKKGATANIEELMAFANVHIYERAAIPKKIYIIDQLPVTAVGKIFKPELINQQVIEVYSEIVNTIEGIQRFSVNMEKSEIKGTVAKIIVEANPNYDDAKIRQSLVDALALFTMKYEIIMSRGEKQSK
jgi:fatty-acyl-CoA synthase